MNAKATDTKTREDLFMAEHRKTPGGTGNDGLSHAFRSDETPSFEQMVSGLFNHSTPEQKSGFVSHLLGVLGPAGFARALSAAGMGQGPRGVSSGGSLTATLSPEAMQAMAQRSGAKDPSIVHKAANFFSEHPTLVKSIGVGALALLMRHISSSRR